MNLIYSSVLLSIITIASPAYTSHHLLTEAQCASILTSIRQKNKALCLHCNKFFCNQRSLKRHLLRISNPQKFPCPHQCGVFFADKCSAKRHGRRIACLKKKLLRKNIRAAIELKNREKDKAYRNQLLLTEPRGLEPRQQDMHSRVKPKTCLGTAQYMNTSARTDIALEEKEKIYGAITQEERRAQEQLLHQ